MQHTFTLVLKVAALITMGAVGGFWWGSGPVTDAWREERGDGASTQEYKYINPLLSCDAAELGGSSAAILKTLKDEVVDVVDTYMSKNGISKASVYVRELNDGGWIGVNEREEFTPGSLLKVPAVMALYHFAEEKDPEIISRQIEFGGGDVGAFQHYPPQVSLEKDQQYTMPELIKRALVYSDNNAASIIAQSIDQKYLFNTYTELGLRSPSLGSDYLVRVKDYAAFFRILYNATYISRVHSEATLQTLTDSTFTRGIVAGLPRGTPVAHKFGERVIDTSTEQLHDCGIVYTKNPYIICVMSQGNDFEKLEKFIEEVSKTTYKHLGK